MPKANHSFLTRLFVCAATMALCLSAHGASAAPVTVSFDDIIAPPGCNGSIGSGYGGLNWSSGFLLECNSDFTGAQGNTHGSPSGEYAATNSSDIGGGLIDVTSVSGTFDFLSASFSSFGFQDTLASYSAQSLELIGYRPGDDPDHPTYVASIDLDPQQYLSTGFNWTGLTRLAFAAGNGPAADLFTTFGVDGSSWLMDDARFETGANTPVPEPATLLLASLGVGVAFVRRRRAA